LKRKTKKRQTTKARTTKIGDEEEEGIEENMSKSESGCIIIASGR
jgi:hypothetical protein